MIRGNRTLSFRRSRTRHDRLLCFSFDFPPPFHLESPRPEQVPSQGHLNRKIRKLVLAETTRRISEIDQLDLFLI